MKLFNLFKKEKNPTKKEVKLPIRIITENVNKTLTDFAKEYNFPLSSLDFDIIDFKTFIKVNNEPTIEIDKKELKLLDHNFFRENNTISQKYTISIRKYEINDYLDLIGKVEIDKTLSEANYILSSKSHIVYKEGIEKLFLNEMHKKKLKNSMLIGVFEKGLEEKIEEVISTIRIDKLENDVVIPLCKAIKPVFPVDAVINYVYKKNKQRLRKELVYPVKEGELLIEFLKPKEGKNGRNCKGEIIKVPKPRIINIDSIEYDSTSIKREEDDKKVLFFAKKSGYLYKDSNNKYYIKDEINVKSINIKTGDILDGENSKIKVTIKEKSYLKEAIGDNSIVESTIVEVKGNVGNNAKVVGKKVKIDAQTHKNSKITADEAYIHIHKGYLEAKTAYINRLENGVVYANEVHIKEVLGGKIVAKKVFIDKLLSHSTIIGLEIVVNYIKGNENKFIVSIEELFKNKDIKSIEKEIKSLEDRLKFLTKEYKKRLEILNKNKSSFEELKQIYKSNKEKGIKTPINLLKKLKDYQEFYKKTEDIKVNIDTIKKDIEFLKEELNSFQNAIFIAKIVSKSDWTPFNRIEFDLIDPPLKLKYDTKGTEKACGFKLKDLGDNFKIAKIKA